MGEQDKSVKIFDYIPDIDAFKAAKEYSCIARMLNLCEWNPVVWIGRFFALDNDYGEHWLDNHDERNELAEKLAQRFNLPPKCNDYTEILVRWYERIDSVLEEKYGINGHEQILIIEQSRFAKKDPCHTDEQRKRFWTDVCKSLHLSLETIFEEAEDAYETHMQLKEEHNFPFEEFDLEKEMNKIEQKYKHVGQEKEEIKVFEYCPDTKGWHTFLLTEEYKEIAEKLNLYEDKCPVRWIGRLFAFDQDYGKLWFENWTARETFREENKKEYYPVNPDRFCDGDNGPCHHSKHRENFWRDVLESLHLSLDTLFEEARAKYQRELALVKSTKRRIYRLAGFYYGEELFDLEKNIEEIKEKYR